MVEVAAAKPAAHVRGSKFRWLKLIFPPMPFHLATGMIASIPIRFAIRAISLDSSQVT